MAFFVILSVIAVFIFFADYMGKMKHYKAIEKEYNVKKPKLDLLEASEKHLEKEKIIFEQHKKTTLCAIKMIVDEKVKGFPWLSGAFADFFSLQDEIEAKHLENKKHPAIVAAEKVREISRLRKDAEKKYRIYKYLIDTYESIFPWLLEFREYTDSEIQELLSIKSKVTDDSKDEAEYLAKNSLLSPQEYQKLSSAEKYQLALDRYWKKRDKSKWEIGRDYERYVGYLYEKEGYSVEYTGINDGFSDLGRDIIAKKNGKIKIVQCKYWAAEKTIHEKHIFQLFGTTVEYRINNFPEEGLFAPRTSDLFDAKIVEPVFITSTKLSDKAKKFAKMLKVEVKETESLKQYACIKCNVNPQTQEKIYHLPFDQQYDKVKIIPSKGEYFVMTVKEAENKGFRRAFRWQGNS